MLVATPGSDPQGPAPVARLRARGFSSGGRGGMMSPPFPTGEGLVSHPSEAKECQVNIRGSSNLPPA